MKKIILYIATSLEGYIARENGSVDWLKKYENTEEDYGYTKFLDSVKTVILGNTTYKQFKAPYPDKICFVFSRKNSGKEENITFVNSDVKEFVKVLEEDGNIWLVGGAEIIKEFQKNNLIDEFIITVIPTILGEGIPLFSKECMEQQLELLTVKTFDSGVVQLHYQSVR